MGTLSFQMQIDVHYKFVICIILLLLRRERNIPVHAIKSIPTRGLRVFSVKGKTGLLGKRENEIDLRITSCFRI